MNNLPQAAELSRSQNVNLSSPTPEASLLTTVVNSSSALGKCHLNYQAELQPLGKAGASWGTPWSSWFPEMK